METVLSSQSIFSGSEYRAPYNTPRERSRERDHCPKKCHQQFPVRKQKVEKFSQHRSRERRRQEKDSILVFEPTESDSNVIKPPAKPVSPSKPEKRTARRLAPVPEELSELSSEILDKDVTVDVFCQHRPHVGSHSRTEHLRKTKKWRKGTTEDEIVQNTCIICAIQKTTSKQIDTVDTIKILESTFFSQNLYGKYSRESKNNEKKQQSSFNICKKADLGDRIKHERKALSDKEEIEIIKLEQQKQHQQPQRQQPEKQNQDYSRNRTSPEEKVHLPQGKEIHSKCRPKSHLVHFSGNKVSKEMDAIYRKNALKGGLLRREHVEKPEAKYYMNKSIYMVKNLGLTYNIPDFNKNLGKRHVSIPASFISRSQSSMLSPVPRSEKLIIPPVRKTRFLPDIEVVN